MGMTDYSFNERIARYRKFKGYSQQVVAEKLNIKTSTYSQMERRGKIDTERLIKLSEILDIDVYTLLFGEQPPLRKEEIIELPKPSYQEIYNRVKAELELKYESKPETFNRFPNQELELFKIICSLKRKQRYSVYDYANKLLRQEIRVK